ncbi:DUF3343 domain-containing protein [Clostridium sp. Cult3]|uniref:DUF3343 domain-containing protein n=1 Tax=Clostridium sp. Cult3 TaxID=2079004 RepID=UPI001F31D6E3|nr:DUF3343 domain-containing protein [Clostridium sp. Cult3]MCF6460973.1 hypothetical protein [Clostridium sp. Cult3]
MKDREFGVITFKSVNYAIKSESVFNGEDIQFRTIPTPREVTHSCGLAIKFDLKDTDLAKRIIEENQLAIEGMFKIIKNKEGSFAEKLN